MTSRSSQIALARITELRTREDVADPSPPEAVLPGGGGFSGMWKGQTLEAITETIGRPMKKT
ncbi:hypothetical protein [Haematobacter genomosp. 1]|uniref:Uncharacterized protein n=1 Tax=Haematobacter genomosp. 1 TaxID=366618 RepID=A0A212AF75_9RHOB|nr:hypothetical protein [Haematobacter genomosp. 1]OWJ80124.1 hypothetical protein CDV49_02255 [Haematobacter genomosp. 1]